MDLLGQLIAALVGGSLALFGVHLTLRHERRLRQQERDGEAADHLVQRYADWAGNVQSMLWAYRRLRAADSISQTSDRDIMKAYATLADAYAEAKSIMLRSRAALLLTEKDGEWQVRVRRVADSCSNGTWHQSWDPLPVATTSEQLIEALAAKVDALLVELQRRHPAIEK